MVSGAVAGEMYSREGWQHPPGSSLVGWVKHYRNSPIVYIQGGDDPEAYANPQFQRLLHNAVRWVASEDAGVSHWTGRRWEHFDGTSGLPDDWVMAVACAGPGQAWAGTYRDGTWFYDGLRWTQVPGVDDWTLSLAAEGDGVWIGTLDGVYGVTPEQTVEVWSPDPRVHQLTVSEGLLLVGSENGLAVYE